MTRDLGDVLTGFGWRPHRRHIASTTYMYDGTCATVTIPDGSTVDDFAAKALIAVGIHAATDGTRTQRRAARNLAATA